VPYLLSSKELIDAKLGSVTTVPETVFVDANGNRAGSLIAGTCRYWSRGPLLKAVIGREANRILCEPPLCVKLHETINFVKAAMDPESDASTLRWRSLTQPTMSEALNGLLTPEE